MTTYFAIEAIIRGYHIYKDIWESSVGKQLFCEIEENNTHNSHAVAIVKTATIVGHEPRMIALGLFGSDKPWVSTLLK